MRKILGLVLVMVLLASAVPLAVTPAAAISEVYEKEIPCDADENNELTKDELVSAILPYMLGEEGAHTLDEVGDAAYVHAYWDGKPKTIEDSYENEVTIYKPMERLVVTSRIILTALRQVKVPTNIIVGIDSHAQVSGGMWGIHNKEFFPEVSGLPSVSTKDPESILKLHPDAVIIMATPGHMFGSDVCADACEAVGITVFRLVKTISGERVAEDAEIFGDLFDRENEADEFIEWYVGSIENPIKEKVENVQEEDKPKVWFKTYSASYVGFYNAYSSYAEPRIAEVGGKDIFAGTPDGNVDPEAVFDRNPDIIITTAPSGSVTGYSVDDTTEIKKVRDEIMNKDELQNVTAVKEGRVYVTSGRFSCCGWYNALGHSFIERLYMAKWVHPELFKDLDPKAIHQEYITDFQGLDIDLDEQGVFVYHPEEHPDGN